MNNDRLKYLLWQYFNDTISNADCVELLNYLGTNNPDEVAELIDEEMLKLEEESKIDGFQGKNILERIKADSRFINTQAGPEKHQTKIISLFRNWRNVAALLIFLSAVSFYFLSDKKKQSENQQSAANAQIVPGSNKATLTLANGKVIVLDSVANGVCAKSGRTVVDKTPKGELIYRTLADSGNSNVNAAVVYNTLSTPRGGQYQVKLPDGTNVWLNSSSSLSYPVEFKGNERRVKLTGEAYFEVAKNKEKPFYVSADNAEIKVLGTHFNIAAYNDDDELTTTLLEGAVQVNKNSKQAFLKPGQQAVIKNSADFIAVSEAEVNSAMAWKNGYFVFDDDNLVTIMKKVSRWYDVDIEYQHHFENQRFGGTFYRSKNITELLHNLEKIGKVHFKVTGRRITVME
ncbi:FecR family protein [Mucilaginibacter sp. SP1R1]|uniref:FecR family protein n=1 Tax=Mucilaginibacter sp. SP1R1 TaxID=2723091 RepID=UPI0016191B50|nr:FecR family protein [Mucilaginibacter sp. SP1R1]MBB6149919.1 hypothetical protein [Mucilaginibacter sp. SP1R1]